MLDNHEGWRGVYALLEVEHSIEPDTPASAEKQVLVEETLANAAGSDGRRERAGGAHA